MATITATSDNFDQLVSDNDIVLVDFWADWCGPCRMFAPIFERASEEHQDIAFVKVDTEAEPELFARTGSTGIPTLLALREGVPVFGQAGALPAPALAQLISAIRELDMEHVHTQHAAHQEAGRASAG